MDWTHAPGQDAEAGDAASGAGAPGPDASAAAAPAEVAAVLESEVADVVFSALQRFLATHPDWNQHRFTTSALATFLFQNGCTDACVQQHYLNALFML